MTAERYLKIFKLLYENMPMNAICFEKLTEEGVYYRIFKGIRFKEFKELSKEEIKAFNLINDYIKKTYNVVVKNAVEYDLDNNSIMFVVLSKDNMNLILSKKIVEEINE